MNFNTYLNFFDLNVILDLIQFRGGPNPSLGTRIK
jgi:hypothetical protein